jgi:hypothetical protein
MASVLAMAAGTLFLSRWTAAISYLNFGLRLVLALGFLGIVWLVALTDQERHFAREQRRDLLSRLKFT